MPQIPRYCPDISCSADAQPSTDNALGLVLDARPPANINASSDGAPLDNIIPRGSTTPVEKDPPATNEEERGSDNTPVVDDPAREAEPLMNEQPPVQVKDRIALGEQGTTSTEDVPMQDSATPMLTDSQGVSSNGIPSPPSPLLADVKVSELPVWMRQVFTYLVENYKGEEETEILRNWVIFELSMASVSVRSLHLNVTTLLI